MPLMPRFSVLFLVLLSFLVTLSAASRVLAAPEATIFIYHRFGEPRYPSTNVAVEVFAEQLQVLKREGFRVLPLKTVVDALASGASLPEKSAVLTVDDAFVSFVEKGLPLIEAHGYPVTLFVSTGSVGRPGYLDWSQLRKLEKRGVTLGHHGSSHLHMATPRSGESGREWAARIAADLEQANRDFKRELGYVPDIFAYPYGEYSPQLIEVVRRAGFRAAMAQQSGVASAFSDPYVLPRFPMGGPYATVAGFTSKLNMHALPVQVVEPESPVLDGKNPPTLLLRFLEPGQVDLDRLNCFVNGAAKCDVSLVDVETALYRIVAEEPLRSRRGKYTLTAPGHDGGWYWFSQLWLNASMAEGGY